MIINDQEQFDGGHERPGTEQEGCYTSLLTVFSSSSLRTSFKHTTLQGHCSICWDGWAWQTEKEWENKRAWNTFWGLQKENDELRRTNEELLEVYEDWSGVNVGKFRDLGGHVPRSEWWKPDPEGPLGTAASACPGPAEQRQREGTELRRAPMSPELTPKRNRGKGKGVNHESNWGSARPPSWELEIHGREKNEKCTENLLTNPLPPKHLHLF